MAVRQSTNPAAARAQRIAELQREAQKYYKVLGRVANTMVDTGEAGSVYSNIYKPKGGDEFNKPDLTPTDLENWLPYERTTYDDNGATSQTVWVSRKAVEESYKQTPEYMKEEAERAGAEERARGQALLERMRAEQQARDEARQAEERQRAEAHQAEVNRINAEIESQRRAFEQEQAQKAENKRSSSIQSAQTQMSALERMAAARETLASKEEPMSGTTEAKVKEAQATVLEKLLKAGKR